MTGSEPAAPRIGGVAAFAAPCPDFAAPMRAIDEVGSCPSDGATRIVATKAVLATDPYLPGHFPGFPIFPGVFLIECVLQAVAAVQATEGGRRPGITELRSARFLAPLLPGDVVTIDASASDSGASEELDVDARCIRSDGVIAARIRLRLRGGGAGDA
jgi:3-hydroxyacyl-[acyl-carrier-protein] dehydratase